MDSSGPRPSPARHHRVPRPPTWTFVLATAVAPALALDDDEAAGVGEWAGAAGSHGRCRCGS